MDISDIGSENFHNLHILVKEILPNGSYITYRTPLYRILELIEKNGQLIDNRIIIN